MGEPGYSMRINVCASKKEVWTRQEMLAEKEKERGEI